MPLQSSVRALKKPPRLDDEVRFLRSWSQKPLHMGAVMPSGRPLARTMAQYVDIDSNDPVIELGPGTGAITSALLIAESTRSVSCWSNTIPVSARCCVTAIRRPRSCKAMPIRCATRFGTVPGAPVSPHRLRPAAGHQADVGRLKLIRDAFAALAPGAPFVQFTYSVTHRSRNRCPAYPTEASERIWTGLRARPRLGVPQRLPACGVRVRGDPF